MSYAKGRWTPHTIRIECPNCGAFLKNPYNGTTALDGSALLAIADEPISIVKCEVCGESYRLPEITKRMM